ncbi:MAG: response regulator [Bacteroidetes bacterium]|nr:MAG: response regulator [Bacteroidota bacterium]
MTTIKNPTICVVDDDEIYQFVIKSQLESRKLARKILMFSDGELAIDFFKTVVDNADELPDLVLLDLNMPIMDGWEFLDEFIMLKPKLPKKVTIYVVTSSINQTDIDRAKRISEVTDYIVKPINEETLMDMLLKLS